MAKNTAAVECFGLFRRDSDDAVQRLMAHFFETYGVVRDFDTVKRFRDLYDYFLHTLTPAERSAERFTRLFCASFLSAEPPHDPREEQRLSAELEDVTRRCRREEDLRLAEEQRRQALGQELKQLHGGIYRTRYSELMHQVEEHSAELRQRDGALRGELQIVERRLDTTREMAAKLETPLEKELHRDTQDLLEQRAGAITTDLQEIADELDALTSDGAGSEEKPTQPLVSALRRIKQEARADGMDALTGLPSRETFEEVLQQRLAAFQDSMEGENFSLVYLALTGLDGIGVARGHVAGLAVLQATGDLLQTLRRHTDIAYRYGDGEFVVVLPQTPAAGAAVFVDYLRSKLAELEIKGTDEETIQVAHSIGICDAATGGPALVRCAAQACERAKEGEGDTAVTFCDEAFLPSPPEHVPGDLVAAVRDYLLLQRNFSVVGLVPRVLDALAEVETQVREAFSAPTVAGDDCLFVLLEERDADTAIREIDTRMHDLLQTAGAADVSEIPGPTVAPPTARASAIISQMLEMIG